VLSPNGPSFFLVITIHQVIWASPGTGYPRQHSKFDASALLIPPPNLGAGIPFPVFQFWCGEDCFLRNSTLKWFVERPRGGSKGVIPCSCNLALGGANWYLYIRGLSVSTTLQERGPVCGYPPRLRMRRLPAPSKIGEGRQPKINI